MAEFLKKVKTLYWFLVLVPIAALAHYLHAPPVFTFIVAALSLIPLSGLLGDATEQLAAHVGDTIGGLLNATFGNMTELIIIIVALRAGLFDLVKASIIGSVLGNLLFVLGASIVAGTWCHGDLKFDKEKTLPSLTSLFIAMAAISAPTVLEVSMIQTGVKSQKEIMDIVEKLSVVGSAVLIFLYFMTVIHQIKTDKKPGRVKIIEWHKDIEGDWPMVLAVAVLGISTIVMVGMSEIVVNHVEYFCQSIHWSQTFVGLVIIPIVGNVAEHFVAVEVATKKRMDLSLAVSIGSATQIGLLVAPVAVFAALIMGTELTLLFPLHSLFAIGAALVISWSVIQDGVVTWIEGVQLLGLYVIIAFFFFLV